jgi:hypothetical protein
VDEGRKRGIGIVAAILTSLHMRTADDLPATTATDKRSPIT